MAARFIGTPAKPRSCSLQNQQRVMMASSHASLADVLDARPMSKDLAVALDKAWTTLADRGIIRTNLPTKGDPTGDAAETGTGLLTYLTAIMSCGSKGTKVISLLGVKESSLVTHIHSLFCVSAGNYADPTLCGVIGALPVGGAPSFIQFTPLHFVARFSFLCVSRAGFESNLMGLSSSECLDNLKQDPMGWEDDDARRIRSRRACFFPPELVAALYELRARPTIAEVAPKLFCSVLALKPES